MIETKEIIAFFRWVLKLSWLEDFLAWFGEGLKALDLLAILEAVILGSLTTLVLLFLFICSPVLLPLALLGHWLKNRRNHD